MLVLSLTLLSTILQMACGSSEAYITVFRPATPGDTLDGPHLWNDQLLQYAAYRNEDGSVMGDPKNVSKARASFSLSLRQNAYLRLISHCSPSSCSRR